MGNTVFNTQVNPSDQLNMSNGLTAVFIDTLCLAGADIATEYFQKDLMIWLAQRDWMLFGLGCIGFDISEIIWDKALFAAQKAFLLQVVDRALAKTHWELLDYSPHEEWTLRSLREFGRMLREFEERHIVVGEQLPLLPLDTPYAQCPLHHVYLHVGGCVVCNNF